MTREQEQHLEELTQFLDAAIGHRYIEALRAALATIRALPATADGVRVVPGITVWYLTESDVDFFDVDHIDAQKWMWMKDGRGGARCNINGLHTVYSTSAAARAAREQESK